MLGGFEIVLNGIGIERWRAGRAKALLQYMLANVGRPISRGELIENVWQESAASAPATALKVAVHSLRQMLGEIEVRGARERAAGQARLAILSHNSGYLLVASGVPIDVQDFDRAVNRALRCERAGDEVAAIDSYRAAVKEYRGAYLPHCPDSWAAVERERLKDLSLHAFERLSANAEKQGDFSAVLELNHRMLKIDPCREESYRALMRCHARQGQLGRVRDWYHTCVHQLATRLDARPDAETQQAFRDLVSMRFRTNSRSLPACGRQSARPPRRQRVPVDLPVARHRQPIGDLE